MPLEDEFNEALSEWKQHCRKNSMHSMSQPYLDCNAYRKIVSMGKDILPLIRREYAQPQEIGDPGYLWGFAIKSIIPEFSLSVGEKGSGSAVEKVAPGFIGIKIDDVRKETLRWLDDYVSRNT